MKNKFLIVFFVLLSVSTLACTHYSVSVHVYSAYNNEPITNVRVDLIPNDKERLRQTKQTDTNGNVVFEQIRKRNLTLVISTPNGLYLQVDTIRWRNDRKTRLTFEQMLYPGKIREQEIWKMEDSIYGTEESLDNFSEYNARGAQFKEGRSGFFQFVQQNFRYPDESLENEIAGKTYARFIIEKDGRPSHIEVQRGLSPEVDAEIIRLIRSMPDWEPARMNGSKVRIRCGLPILFEVL